MKTDPVRYELCLDVLAKIPVPDKRLRDAINQFSKHLDPSCTYVSNSFTSLVSRCLDTAVRLVIDSYSGKWESRLLPACTFSRAIKEPSAWTVDVVSWNRLSAAGVKNPTERSVFPKKLTDSQMNVVRSALIKDNLECLRDNFKFLIHSIFESESSHDDIRPHDICENLDAIFQLIDAFLILRPKRTFHPGHGPLSSRALAPNSFSYCVLCWRASMRTRAFLSSEKEIPETSSARSLSDKYCEIHNPSPFVKNSRYRLDLPYKKAFDRELRALHIHPSAESHYLIRFYPPENSSASEYRKAAYDLVHSGLQSPNSMGSPSKREIIYNLHIRGCTQVSIAEQLGISKQAVFKSIRSVQEILTVRESESYVFDSSDEAWSKCIGDELVSQVITLQKQGLGTAAIAQQTKKFKHTIHAVKFWLENHCEKL